MHSHNVNKQRNAISRFYEIVTLRKQLVAKKHNTQMRSANLTSSQKKESGSRQRTSPHSRKKKAEFHNKIFVCKSCPQEGLDVAAHTRGSYKCGVIDGTQQLDAKAVDCKIMQQKIIRCATRVHM